MTPRAATRLHLDQMLRLAMAEATVATAALAPSYASGSPGAAGARNAAISDATLAVSASSDCEDHLRPLRHARIVLYHRPR